MSTSASSIFSTGGGSKTLHWQEFTASGTFTPSSALIAAGGACWVRVVGGGGGGGGGNAGVNYSGGGGGGSGEDITRPATITSAQTVTIGAGGSIFSSIPAIPAASIAAMAR